MTATLRTKLRRDGSVRYWSVAAQEWVDGWAVPPGDLQSMIPKERARVLKHMQKHGTAKPCACEKPKGKKGHHHP